MHKHANIYRYVYMYMLEREVVIAFTTPFERVTV
jgi:hypothetical protein